MNFGFKINVSGVAAGQRASALEVEPQLIVKNGRGGFALTATGSKGMNIAVGENIQFYNNIDGIMDLIRSKNEEFALYCEQNELDLTTDAGIEETVVKMTQWYLAKGIQLFDRKGNALKVSERTSKEEKLEYIKNSWVEIVENSREALINRAIADGKDGENMTDEELSAYISLDDIQGGERDQISGSLTSNAAKRIGTGCPLNFTDSHIWNQLRNQATAGQNAVYEVDVTAPEEAEVSNGYETVKVRMYPISFKEYTEVISRNFKKK